MHEQIEKEDECPSRGEREGKGERKEARERNGNFL